MPSIKCPACGLFNNATAKFCNRCGAAIAPESTNEQFSDYKQFIYAKNSLIEKYTLLGELGHGGMANVYKAIQNNLNRIVAIKIIHSNLLNDIESVKRFHEEAKTAASLNHPNIITIYDEGELNGIHYIVMEYLEGLDLAKIIKNQGVISETHFKSIFIPIAKALQYLHDKELIHGDIKSSNIFITNDGRPILMDFGIANIKNFGQRQFGSTLYGTPEYMSPEQTNYSIIDERSDLFSLGIVMYECLTGVLPFHGESLQDTMKQITDSIHHPVRNFNKSINKKYEYIISKLLAKKPEQRFQSGNDLIDAFRKKVIPITLNHRGLLIGSIVGVSIIILFSLLLLVKNSNNKLKIKNESNQETEMIDNEIVSEKPENIQQKQIEPDSRNAPFQTQNRQSENTMKNINQSAIPLNRSNSIYIDSLINKANLLRDIGIKNNSKTRLEEAKEVYKKAQKLDPQSFYLQQQIDYIESFNDK